MPIYDLECSACGVKEERYVPLTTSARTCTCGAEMDRVWSITSRSGYMSYPYETAHITGKRITVTDAGHERALLAAHGKVKRDDASYVDENYLGYSWGKYNHETGKREGQGQRYSSGGRGNPGSW